YALQETPTVSGLIRFRAAMYDQIGAKNRCSVQAMQLTLDGKPVYRVNFNTFTFKTNHRVGLLYDFNQTRYYPAQYYYKLYNSYGLMPYANSFSQNGGIWDTTQESEGLHTLAIHAEDAAGLKTTANFKVRVVRNEKAYGGMGVREYGSTGKISQTPTRPNSHTPKLPHSLTVGLRDFGNFIEVVALPSMPLRALPEMTVQQRGGRKVQIPVRQAGKNRFVGTYDLIPGLDGPAQIMVFAMDSTGQVFQAQEMFLVQTVFAQKGGTARWGRGTVITFPSGSLYEDTFVNIVPEVDYNEEAQLPLVSSVYEFRPRGIPLEERATISLRYPSQVKDLKKLGIYRWDPLQKGWKYLDDKLNVSRQTVSAQVNFLASYAIMIDNATPVISDLQFDSRDKANSRVRDLLLEISAIIRDRGKGVDEASIVMELDGIAVDAEYDPDRDKVAFQLERPLKPGKHTLRVRASDLAGNKTTPAQSEFW
ncbi:MAG: hypothetical protein L0Y56_14715, partial [Nitrospira sp.]|nr:hypothetical protein [Nitrospira sp.]